MSEVNRYYMAAIDLRGKRALVVGAGNVAQEKIENLLLCGAEVRVVAPETGEAAAALAESGEIELRQRAYAAGDLDGCFLAVAATGDVEVDKDVHSDCEERGMLVNVADVPSLCNFILPAVARVGPVAIAVSTAGASPALAKRLRREIAESFGDEYADLAAMLADIRDWAKATLPTYGDRRDFFEGIVNGNPDPIELLRSGDRKGARQLIVAAQKRAEESR